MKPIFFVLCIASVSSLWSQSQQDSWTITTGSIDPDHYYGITVANGMIGLVSSPDPLKIKDVVLNGVYDYYQRGRVNNILKTFNHLDLDIEVDGKRINRKNSTHYTQTLDMKQASFITEFEALDKVSVKTSLMALRNLPFTAMLVVQLKALQDVEITSINTISSPEHLSDVRNYYAEIDRPHVNIPLMTSVAYSPSGKKLASSASFIFPETKEHEPNVIHEDWDYNRHLSKFRRKLKAGETYTFAVVGSTISSAHNNDPQNEAERLTIFAKLEGIERLKNAHLQAWKELWNSDITVNGGNEQEQRAIHSALYHLYSFAREGTAYSLSPMGLSGLGYNGHVFWDTELWMFPPLLVLQPQIAKSLLEYRYQRLEAAKKNAFAHGYKGAMFPWESADDGSEVTPVWALTGPFQQHISATVGWAFWKYYEVTKDKIWLETRGYPVLKEVADFWISRVERKGAGRFEINNVIGANEWEENINNNAFTNGMVKTVLNYASVAATALKLAPNPDWKFVADNIPILHFPDGTTRENETYNGAMIKQSDVNLLAYPLNVVSEKANIEKDISYYEPRLSPDGPAMGAAILSVLYARLGNVSKATELFQKSYQPNQLPPFGVLAETAGGTNPYFATGAGGMLQAVLFGFAGLDITDQGIVQRQSVLPEHWKSLTITGVGIAEKTIEKK